MPIYQRAHCRMRSVCARQCELHPGPLLRLFHRDHHLSAVERPQAAVRRHAVKQPRQRQQRLPIQRDAQAVAAAVGDGETARGAGTAGGAAHTYLHLVLRLRPRVAGALAARQHLLVHVAGCGCGRAMCCARCRRPGALRRQLLAREGQVGLAAFRAPANAADVRVAVDGQAGEARSGGERLCARIARPPAQRAHLIDIQPHALPAVVSGRWRQRVRLACAACGCCLRRLPVRCQCGVATSANQRPCVMHTASTRQCAIL
mmetsp:Transcript_27127/g.70385  ORF Transcript_27127/g.70385 Transcript_27127/m.70385 type:complete len:260 (+) Transcript_27127:1099-1878(+)